MKKLLLLLILVPLIGFSQVQMGQDIDGEYAEDWSGGSVSLSADGSIVAIGATNNDGNGINSGQVRVYNIIEGIWIQLGNDIYGEAEDDLSGTSVSLSSDGNTIAIAAGGNDGNGVNSGHVRVYNNIEGVWLQVGSDINGEASGDATNKVSLSPDGLVVAIGTSNNDGNGIYSGHVRVFNNVNGNWMQVGSDIDGKDEDDRFGRSVSLNFDGSILAIGAPFFSASNIAENGYEEGYVRIYKNIENVWTQIGSDLVGEHDYSAFGTSVSLSLDGTFLAIGATRNHGVNGSLSGHVRIYENIENTWTQVGSDIDGEALYDHSGVSVSLSSDGSVVAIGSSFNNGINGNYSGHVRVYKNLGDVWTQIGMDIDGEAVQDNFGYSVSLSSDGLVLASGTPYNAGNGYRSGHVRVYDISESALSTSSNILESFNLYPNPTKTQFTIQLENNTELKNVTIYNKLGQQILSSKEIVINTSNLSAGIYVVEIETNKGKGSNKLIIE